MGVETLAPALLTARAVSPILIYCRSTIGHRQIYCNVLAGYFLDRGHAVVVAVGLDSLDPAAPRPPFIEALRARPRAQIVYLHGDDALGEAARELDTIARLQEAHGVGATFFADADSVRLALNRIRAAGGRPRLTGQIWMLFLRHLSLTPTLAREPGLSPLRSIRRKIRGVADDFAFFHHHLPALGAPVLSFTLDPRFVTLMRRPDLAWLPDIYRHFGANPAAFAQDALLAELQGFVARTAGREIVLYFGTNQDRRGYDWLLQAVQADPGLAFLHAGKLNEAKAMSDAARAIRHSLAAQGRLFETRAFITDDRIVDLAFSSTSYVLLPYSGHYGSSGVSIQSASYGKPILVPDDGLMGYWVRRTGCGLTFRAGDRRAFLDRFAELRRAWQRYAPATARYVEHFSQQSLYQALDARLAPQIAQITATASLQP